MAEAGVGGDGFVAEPVPVGERLVAGLFEAPEAVLQLGDETLRVGLSDLGGAEEELADFAGLLGVPPSALTQSLLPPIQDTWDI